MFKNREEAAGVLAEKLNYLKIQNPLILAIPRGGVVIGKILSGKLRCGLKILVVKKIGAPHNPELAIGALGPEGTAVWNEEIVSELGLSQVDLQKAVRETKEKVESYQAKFSPGQKFDLGDKTVILTDDGLATGATAEAAIAWIRKQNPEKIVLAVPVAPPEVTDRLKGQVNDIIILEKPVSFQAVGQFYEDFPQITDEEVIRLIKYD